MPRSSRVGSHTSLLAVLVLGQLTYLLKNKDLLDIMSKKSVKNQRFSQRVNQKASCQVLDLQIHFSKIAVAVACFQSHQAEQNKTRFSVFLADAV